MLRREQFWLYLELHKEKKPFLDINSFWGLEKTEEFTEIKERI